MILTADIGNSNIVLGVFEGDILKLTLRIKTDATRTRDEYAINLNSMLKINNINVSDIDGAIISSVVPIFRRRLPALSKCLSERRRL